MRVAQHHGDHRCVTHALAWLQLIMSSSSPASSASSSSANLPRQQLQRNAARLLQRAAKRASELGLPHLKALTSFTLSAVGVRAPHGNPATATTAAASTDTASSLLVVPGTFAEGEPSSDSKKDGPPTSLDVHALLSRQLGWADGVVSLNARAALLRAQIWGRTGHQALHVATLRKQVAAYARTSAGRTLDAVAAMCQLAHAEAHCSFFRVTEELVRNGDGGGGGGGGGGGRHIVHGNLSRKSEQLILPALRTLCTARAELVVSSDGVEARRLWTHATCALLFDACLLRGELGRCEDLVRRLAQLCGVVEYGQQYGGGGGTAAAAVVDSSNDDGGGRGIDSGEASYSSDLLPAERAALRADVQLKWCELLVARGEHAAAYSLCNGRLVPYCASRGFAFRGVLARLLAARAAFEATGTGASLAGGGPGSGPAAVASSARSGRGGADGALAMSALLECKAALAHLSGVNLPAGVTSTTALESRLLVLQARIDLQGGRPMRALRTLDEAMPHVLAHCSPCVQGGACLFLALLFVVACPSSPCALLMSMPLDAFCRCTSVSRQVPAGAGLLAHASFSGCWRWCWREQQVGLFFCVCQQEETWGRLEQQRRRRERRRERRR